MSSDKSDQKPRILESMELSWCPHCEAFINTGNNACGCGHPYICWCITDKVVLRLPELIEHQKETFMPYYVSKCIDSGIKLMLDKGFLDNEDKDYLHFRKEVEEEGRKIISILEYSEHFLLLLKKKKLISSESYWNALSFPKSEGFKDRTMRVTFGVLNLLRQKEYINQAEFEGIFDISNYKLADENELSEE